MKLFGLKLGRDQRGQGIDIGTILGVIGVLIAIIVGALVYTKVSDAMDNITEENSLGENIRKDVDDVAGTIFTILPILILVSIVLSLFVIFRPPTGA